MDTDRFDALTRFFAAQSSRRLLWSVLATAFGPAGSFFIGADPTQARKGKRKKKKKQSRPLVPIVPACVPNCAGKICGDNGCGGSCGTCSSPLTCQAGQCACPEGEELCGGACLPFCPLFQVHNPLTCACCTVSSNVLPASCSEDEECCSGVCNTIVFHFCIGRGEGQPCDFGAQCQSGTCTSAGTCTAPPP
jgi:hypothetical protein